MTEERNRTVAVLGTGAIGTAVATTLLRAGHPVVVWNRTPERTADARAAGATVAPGPAEAVASAGIALVCLTDHDGVRALLGSLPPMTPPTAVAVLATGTADDATRAAALAAERGLDYLDVGVQASPEDLGTPGATLLYAGRSTVLEAHRQVLETLGPVTWVGEDPASAAVWDLALFGLWYDAQLGLLRALEAVTAAGVPASAFAGAARRQLTHVVEATVATADEVADRRHPRGPASLAEHSPVLDQLLESRTSGGLGDGGLATIADLVARLVDRGHGDRGLSAIVDSQLLA